MLYLLAISVIGWGFTDYQVIFQSLIIGIVAGFFNLFLLQKKIDIMGEKVANNQTAKSFGTLSRFAAAAWLSSSFYDIRSNSHYRSSCGFNDTILSHYDRFYFQ